MAFTTKTWQNGSGGGTPLDAAGLNDLESRISSALVATGSSVSSVNGNPPDGAGDVTLVASDVGARPDTWTPGVADLPAGSVMVQRYTASTGRTRPTSRTDVTVMWVGPAASPPPIVSTGTGGMLNNVDLQIPTP